MYCQNGNALLLSVVILLWVKSTSSTNFNNTEDNEEACETDEDLRKLLKLYHCKIQTRTLQTHDEQCPWTYVTRDFCIFDGDPTPEEDNATCTFQCKAETSTMEPLSYRCLGGAIKTMDVVEHECCKVVYYNRENESEHDGTPVSSAVLVYLCVQPVVTFGGLFGNTLSFILMTSKSMREYSFSNYLAALAITDSICLLHFTMDWVDEVSKNFPFKFRYEYAISCKLYPYIIQVSMLMSSWLLTIFSIDRCINICYPFYTGGIFTKLGSKRVILLLFVAISSSQLYLPILQQKDICTGIFYVQHMSGDVTIQGGMALLSRLLLMLIIPFLCVLVSNGKIICAVRSRVAPSVSMEGNTGKAERRMTIKLVSLSASFLILASPDTLRAIIQLVHEIQGDKYALAVLQGMTPVTWLIFAVNFAINFLFYGITFRDKLPTLSQCKFRKHRSPISQTIQTGTTMSTLHGMINLLLTFEFQDCKATNS